MTTIQLNDLIAHWDNRYEECCTELQRHIDRGANTEPVINHIVREQIYQRWVALVKLRARRSRPVPDRLMWPVKAASLSCLSVGYYC